MSSLDWIILGLFFLGLIGIIVWVLLQKEKDTSDYFLAGRDATWIAIGASIFASNIGSEHLVGLAGAGAESGMAMAHWEMHGWMILMLGWLFVPFYARSKVFTMPEFLERRYNPHARSFLSVISIVSYVLTKVAVTVYAGGVVFKDVFNIDYVTFFGYNIDFFWISAIGLVVLTGLYTTFGGMKAVLYTSVLQTPILLIGSIAILVLGIIKVGGWNELMEITRANVTVHGDSMTSLMRSHNDPDFPWTGVILGSAIIGFWYWCTDQFIVQRVLSGRDMKQARRGAIFGAYLKLTPVFIFLIPGMIAYALNQKGLITLSSNDAAFSTLVTELLPIGFKGIVIGGILAALMSSLASLFNSSAMLFTIDFYKKYVPDATEKHYVLVGRLATVVIVLLGILWIPVMKGIGKVLYEYLQDVQSLLAPGIAAVFLLGVISKKTTPAAGLWGLIIGFTLGMLRLGLNVFSGSVGEESILYKVILSHNWLHYEIYLFILVIISMIVISYFTKPKDPNTIVGLTMGSATAEQRAEVRDSWGKWDVINSIVIIVIIIAFYSYFW
ncbi:sodium:solute symporter [Maribellus sediminis]|uniref:sodium:solute symporter n=1 Tax=Maribellus sediminis TaxID=2696285 RepID=UPI0014320EE7|nr:sodium:solute symporter [Maribellus sediminis]